MKLWGVELWGWGRGRCSVLRVGEVRSKIAFRKVIFKLSSPPCGLFRPQADHGLAFTYCSARTQGHRAKYRNTHVHAYVAVHLSCRIKAPALYRTNEAHSSLLPKLITQNSGEAMHIC